MFSACVETGFYISYTNFCKRKIFKEMLGNIFIIWLTDNLPNLVYVGSFTNHINSEIENIKPKAFYKSWWLFWMDKLVFFF